jgi:hypothetical protein
MLNNEETLLAEIANARQKAVTDTSYNNTASKNLAKLELGLEFLRLGGDGIRVYHDHLTIDQKYHVTLSGKKWRVFGKNKWYPSGDPQTLLHKLRGSSDAE